MYESDEMEHSYQLNQFTFDRYCLSPELKKLSGQNKENNHFEKWLKSTFHAFISIFGPSLSGNKTKSWNDAPIQKI